MKPIILLLFVCQLTSNLSAQTFSWSGYTNGATSYTTGAMTATITSSAPGFQNSTPRHFAAATVGSGQCGIAGGLALEHLFGNITTAHATLTLNFTTGGTTPGLCSVITFPIRDINSDESVQTFADWVEISAIDGNNAAIPVGSITASGGSNKVITTSGNTRIIKGYSSGSYSSRSTTACDNVNISVTPPVGVAVKSITIKYHPDYTVSPNHYYNFTSPLRPAYQYISIGSITATPTGACVPLPVGLSSFSAKRNDRSVALNWMTESEINNDYFLLQRTNDGENYEDIAVVPAKGGLLKPTSYTFSDANDALITTYYRLVQVDNDGTKTYFDLVDVTPIESSSMLQDVYPNPTRMLVTYPMISDQNQTIQVVMVDNLGRIMETIEHHLTKGTSFPFIDMSTYKAGTYHLIAISESGEKQVKIIQKID